MTEDWIEVELGEICFTTSGGTPSRNNLEFYQGSIPWVKSGELDKGIIYDTEEHISEDAIKKSSAKIFPEGSLLIALYGATIGKLAFLGVDATTNQAICGIYKTEGIESKYLYNFLLNRKQKLISQGTGGAQPNISQTILKKLEVPLAPLPIQRAIVSKIEALFSDLDNGIANFKKAQEQLKIYRQAVLKKAFEGELTKDWRAKQSNLPTAEQLLKQIKEERQNYYNQQIEDWKKAVKDWEKKGSVGDKPRKPSLQKAFPPLKDDELNILPKFWKWVNWSEIIDYNEGAFKRGPFGSSLTKSMFVKSGYKVYEQYCPINDDCSFERYYITDEKFKELNSFSVKQGDFLISCSGVTLGRITQVPDKFKEGVINQALLRLRINKDFVNEKFFIYYFRSPFFQKQIFDNSTGSAIPNIKGVNELKVIPVPLLTKAEQTQIILEIESRLSVCDKVEQTINESILKAEVLRQSILKKAFEGKLLSKLEIELCKKDADYEPASELLKKIKAEKLAKEEALKKTQGKKKIITKNKSKK